MSAESGSSNSEREAAASSVLEMITERFEEGVKVTLTREGVANHTERWNATRPDGIIAARVTDVIALIQEIGEELFNVTVDPENMVMAEDTAESNENYNQSEISVMASSIWNVISVSELARSGKSFGEIIKDTEIEQLVATVFINHANGRTLCSVPVIWDELAKNHSSINTPENKTLFAETFKPAKILAVKSAAAKRVQARRDRWKK